MSRDGYCDEWTERNKEFEDMLELVDPEGVAALKELQPDPDVSSEAMVVKFPKAA